MSTGPAPFDAGRPRISGPIRRLSRSVGWIGLPLAGTRWIPLYAILRHTGRRSGTAYATPVVGLRTQDGFLIPLPFGDQTQWAKNLFAAGDGGLRRVGREYRVAEPSVIDLAEAGASMPWIVRRLAGAFGIRQWVRVRSLLSTDP